MRWLLASGVVLVCLFSVAVAGTDTVDDPAAWLSARGVKDPAKQLGDTCCCVEVSVGSASEHALRCSEATSIPTEGADIAVREVIRVVRAGKVVKVLEAWTALENLDLPPRSPPALKLELAIAPSARTATIVDAGGSRNRCDELPPRTKAVTAADRVYRTWRDRICASRGTYRWGGGRFVHAAR